MNTAVTALLGLGADAMDNLFDVEVSLPTGGAAEVKAVGSTSTTDPKELTKQYRLRCQGFTPPKFNVKTYDVKYKTIKIKRPASVMEGDRVFELQFRLDANYDTYRALADWRAKTLVLTSGLARNALDLANGGTITVSTAAAPVKEDASTGVYQGVTEDTSVTSAPDLEPASWIFMNVWLTELSEPAFKQGGGDPIMITAKFAFGEFEDPYHKWAGIGGNY